MQTSYQRPFEDAKLFFLINKWYTVVFKEVIILRIYRVQNINLIKHLEKLNKYQKLNYYN